MKTKRFQGKMEVKEEGAPGSFRAVFATLNVIDSDREVTTPGAFQEGQAVRIAYWGHRWGDLPVGRGVIHANETEAWVDGQFFMNTTAGRETYETVKGLGELQEWSYGFDVDRSRQGEFAGQTVTFLDGLTVYEVSPVMLGAGVDTRTVEIKGDEGRRPSAGDERRGTPGGDEGGQDEGGQDRGQAGEGSSHQGGAAHGEPSGASPAVVLSEIEIELMEV